MISYDPNQDAYVILGVHPEASPAEVEAAFRRAARTWHPDKSPAPDAHERFLEVRRAGEILRDPESRRFYNLLRERHIGRTFRVKREPVGAAAEPYVPMRPPPAWLAPRVRVHLDAVLMTLETPRTTAAVTRLCNALALVALGGAVAGSELMLGLLALVLWAIGRVFRVPPHRGLLAWAKIVPGRRIAEVHSLDQRHHRYERHTVPYAVLRVAVVSADGEYRIEIRGLPRTEAPVLLRTGDLEEAKRCAREAGDWLNLPLARAA